VTKDNSEIE